MHVSHVYIYKLQTPRHSEFTGCTSSLTKIFGKGTYCTKMLIKNSSILRAWFKILIGWNYKFYSWFKILT